MALNKFTFDLDMCCVTWNLFFNVVDLFLEKNHVNLQCILHIITER